METIEYFEKPTVVAISNKTGKKIEMTVEGENAIVSASNVFGDSELIAAMQAVATRRRLKTISYVEKGRPGSTV